MEQLIMWLTVFFRPKNFQVEQMLLHKDNELIPVESFEPEESGYIDYYFGGRLYTHIGHWPIDSTVARFLIPVHNAVFVDDETSTSTECTEIVRRHSGPTQSPVSFDIYVPRPHFTISFTGGLRISMKIKWVRIKKVSGVLHVKNVLGQTSNVEV